MHNQRKFYIKILLLHVLFKQKTKRMCVCVCVCVSMRTHICFHCLYPPNLWNSLNFCTSTIILAPVLLLQSFVASEPVLKFKDHLKIILLTLCNVFMK